MIALNKTTKAAGNIVLLTNEESGIAGVDGNFDTVYLNKKLKEEDNGIFTLPNGEYTLFIVRISKEDSDKNIQLEDLRQLGGRITETLNKEKVEKASIRNMILDIDNAMALIEGVVLANYQYLKFKTKDTPHSLSTLDVISDLEQSHLDEIINVSEAVYLARDLVNEPVISLTARKFSDSMIKGGEKAGYTTKVLSKSEIEALNMGGLLGVNLGSIDDPTFNILEWKPEGHINEKPLVFVGKGVVYDTGGYNIKTGNYMNGMKADMGGGAAVTGAIYAIAKNKLPIWTISLIPATDNRIGKNALVADDVITISDGTTVEVKNTDAEGRLILADALVYAKQYDPEVVIDMATLTGAAYAITGGFGSALCQKADSKFVEMLKEAGEESYERLTEMPFWREYRDLLKSNIADISNLGGPVGGVTTAGKFLHHFTDYDWMHIDLAGPSFLDTSEPYKPVGGTGVGARLGYLFAKKMIER